MNCREVRRWLSPYLDSELGKTKTFEVSEHLRQCESCALRFERERRVDATVVAKLSGVPAMDFGEMVREAAKPSRSLFGPWRLGLMGVAACVALVAWVSLGPSSTRVATAGEWIASEFMVATPEAKAFERTDEESLDVVGQVRATLGVTLTMKSMVEAFPGHAVDLVSVRERTLGDRVSYVEVRLNCCGQPVLLAFAPRSEIGLLGSIPEGAELGATRRDDASGLNLAMWATEELVLVAASRHSVANIVPAFSIDAA